MKKRDDIFVIDVVNWQTHSRKKASKKMFYYQFPADIWANNDWLRLSSGAKIVWLYLVCHRSLSNPSPCRVSARMISTLCRLKPKSVPKVLNELCEIEWIQILSSPFCDTKTAIYSNNIVENSIVVEPTVLQVQPATEQPHQSELILEKTEEPDAQQPKIKLDLVAIWNDNCLQLPKVRPPVSESRKIKIKRCLRDCSDASQWIEAVQRLAQSDFANGQNDRKWIADFDFLLKPDTRHRILEGRYDNRTYMGNKESIWLP